MQVWRAWWLPLSVNLKRIVKKIILALVVIVSLFLIGTLFVRQPALEPLNFDDCVEKGFPVMESYPRQCASKNKTFVEDIGNASQKIDLIVLESPRPNSRVGDTITLSGIARGYWFFEATFPIDVLDANNKVIGQGYGEAKGEWMTENFVPFGATVTLKEKPQTKKGTLVLRKDNPSGDPIRDDSLIVPISFE